MLDIAIAYTVYIAKDAKSKYYITITDKEIAIFLKGKLHTYDVAELKSYKHAKKWLYLTEYKLILSSGTALFIRTKKPQELKSILDTLIAENIEK